jgi:hypothetical protein
LTVPEDVRWWGELEIPPGLAGCLRLGPLTLWAERRDQEWRLAHREDEGAEGRLEVRCPCPAPAPDGAEIVRVAMRRVDGRLKLTPSLADRSIVARPEIPFRLLAGGEVALYVSTPVWVRVEAAEPPVVLLDLPTTRPSDTWFGPSTLDGELCYAIRTAARLELANMAPLPERAITEVRLRNLAETVQIERLNLPVPHFTLFADARGGLWTQGMTLERKPDGKLGEVRFDDLPPAAAGPCERVAEPRTGDRRPSLIRALTGFLG